MIHRLLGPSGAYWTTGRPTGQPTGFWAFWGLLNNWQANWMTHRLLGPSGAYWTTGRPTGWPTGFWAFWGLLNDPLNDPLFVQCKLTAGPTERPTIGFSCAYLNDWFKCRSVGWPSWVNFRSRWSVWLGDLNESICPILIGWLSVLVGWPFKLLTWVSCFRWLWWSDWFTNLIHLVRWPG